jgi:hypothetical protein
MVMKLPIPRKAGNFLTTWEASSLSKWPCSIMLINKWTWRRMSDENCSCMPQGGTFLDLDHFRNCLSHSGTEGDASRLSSLQLHQSQLLSWSLRHTDLKVQCTYRSVSVSRSPANISIAVHHYTVKPILKHLGSYSTLHRRRYNCSKYDLCLLRRSTGL